MDDPADATRRPVTAARRVLRWVAGLFAALLAIVLAYLAAAWIGSSLPRGGSVSGDEGGVSIFVETNGIHTGIVMPIAAAEHDWRRVFPEAGAPLPRDRLPTHVAIGYGEREVFLDTPSWGDLRVGTAMRVATLGGPGMIRVQRLADPVAGPQRRRVTLPPAAYRDLAAAIEADLASAGGGARAFASFAPHSRNYLASTRYTMVRNCNQWTANKLAAAGLRVGRWTPLAGGLMKWFPARSAPR